MANVTSLSSNSYSSSSSIYGSRNVLTGLASGMDTETMIENSVVGYQTKIAELQQSQTKLTWKQDAYRELIDQMYNITNSYTSYTSKTNLSSNSFFTSNVTTTANGANAAALSATGKATSDIQINAVTQLATAARYSVDTGALNYSGAFNLTGSAITAGEREVSTISGSLTLMLGATKYTLNFKDDEIYEDADALVTAMNEKLAEQDISVEASLSNGTITFTSTASNGDSVYISGASGNFKSVLGVQSASSSAAEDRFTYNSIQVGDTALSQAQSAADYLSGKTVSVTLNGVTKSVSIGSLTEDSDTSFAEQIATNLQANLDHAFGSGAVTVSSDDNGCLTFGVKENTGSSLLVSSDVEALGLGSGLSNYFNVSKTLGDLLGEDYFLAKGSGEISYDEDAGYYRDENGCRTDESGYLLNEDGDTYFEEKALVINGVSIGSFGKDKTLESVMTSINSNANAKVSMSFSKLTGEFVFTSGVTGSGSTIEFGDGLANRLFQADESTYTVGQDAVVKATVNGKELELTRSSNVIDMDGLTVTLKDTFSAYNEDGTVSKSGAVTFTTSSDADTIVSAIRSFVENINKLMTSVHDAYTTQRVTKTSSSSSSGITYYEPLTDEDKADMSETAIAAWEEKAKTGLLFGDTDLRTLYDKLLTSIQSYGSDRVDMESIGLSTTYSSGVTTISLDETKLRAALESDPDKVRNVFTKTTDSGATTNGLMANIKSTLNAYGSTSLASPGILVSKAGTKLSAVSLLNNNIQSQISNLDSQIENWQTKLSNKIDYYTKQFTRLEQLMSTMNNQSSMLAGLMGY